MSEKPENPNAFPNPFYSNIHGMTLRDWFAGQALANGMCQPVDVDGFDDVAGDCYRMADAMLQERGQ